MARQAGLSLDAISKNRHTGNAIVAAESDIYGAMPMAMASLNGCYAWRAISPILAGWESVSISFLIMKALVIFIPVQRTARIYVVIATWIPFMHAISQQMGNGSSSRQALTCISLILVMNRYAMYRFLCPRSVPN